jgi:hypothetical protein
VVPVAHGKDSTAPGRKPLLMADLSQSRTLVKSAPELWTECSEATTLARHLGAFGEIRVTRLEPETTVAWEGDAARGTVCLEPSGWGTRVTLTAQALSTGIAPPVAGDDALAGALDSLGATRHRPFSR